MLNDIEKYLEKNRVNSIDKDLFKGEYRNRTATGLASLDGSMQFFDKDIYVNGTIMAAFME